MSWSFYSFASPEEFLQNADFNLHEYGVIITDQEFGVISMSGIEFIRQLVYARLFQGIIVGHSGSMLEDEFLSAGAAYFWSKPLPSTDIVVLQFREKAKMLIRSQ